MIKKNFKINSFRFKIAFYYLVASLIVIFIFSGVVYTVVAHIIVQQTVSKTEMAIKTSAESVGEILRYKKSLLEFYSSDKNLKAFALGEEGLQDIVLKQITTIAESDANILGVYVSLNNGVSLMSEENHFVNADSIITEIPCLTSERTASYVHSDQWIITLGIPILDESGIQAGVLGVDLDYCIFSHTFESLNLGGKDLIFIEDSKENLVFRSDKI
ncbi:MAG: cache domain-containing protein [Anaerotignaceae bacterium]